MPTNSLPDFPAYPTQEASSALEARWNIFNAAAKKDLHWWFFALLMIGMIAIGFLYTDMRREREAMRAEIREVRNAQISYITTNNEALMKALINNTQALESNTFMLRRIETK